MRNIIVTVTGDDLSGENPVALKPEDTEVTWTFVDPLNRELRVEFVTCLPADNNFPTNRVSPFTTTTLHSGVLGTLDPSAPFGLYIYVVRDAQGHLLKWPTRVFQVGSFDGRFGTVVPPTGPPNTGTRTTTNSASP